MSVTERRDRKGDRSIFVQGQVGAAAYSGMCSAIDMGLDRDLLQRRLRVSDCGGIANLAWRQWRPQPNRFDRVKRGPRGVLQRIGRGGTQGDIGRGVWGFRLGRAGEWALRMVSGRCRPSGADKEVRPPATR